MGFHHEHTHGRVFHGLEARKIMQMERRDSHGDHIKLNIPKDDNKLNFIHLAGKNSANKDVFIHLAGKNNVKTVVSEVYVTESKTFDGPAVYVTETGSATAATKTPSSGEVSYLNAKSKASNPDHGSAISTASGYQTNPSRFTRTSAATSSVAAAVLSGSPVSTSRGAAHAVGAPYSATRSGSPDLIAQKSNGMTGGAKAGVAFGVIAAIALCAGLIFLCWRRRKDQRENGEKLDEKHASQNSIFSGPAAAFSPPAGNFRSSIQSEKSFRTTAASTAPRLSLRPVTQFLPNILGGSNANASGHSPDVPAMSEKPRDAAQNPFSDAAMLTEKQARPVSPPSNSLDEGDRSEKTINPSTPGHSQNNSIAGSDIMGTPSSATVGTAAAVPIGAAGAARGPANNVHRVQLDFKPSMDDELELRSGQLVRMLYEYDDGWTLCVRMDRSQQGVCPRTCLSKLPVKPRPQGPPPKGPNGRPMGPPPPHMRGPPPSKNGMVPRPLTPTGRERASTMGRSSPAPMDPAGRNRSQSMSNTERPASPANMPARKPVPGQAL